MIVISRTKQKSTLLSLVILMVIMQLTEMLNLRSLIRIPPYCFRVLKGFEQMRLYSSRMESSLNDKIFYSLIAQNSVHIEYIKKSKFLVHVVPVNSISQGLAVVEQLKDPKASHNCFAIKISNDIYRTFDDGEPTGTAGKPILNAIEGQKYCNTLILVIRYFGGVKLGAGGLIRAYQNVAKNALQSVKEENRKIVYPMSNISVHLPTILISQIRRVIEASPGSRIKSQSYSESNPEFIRLVAQVLEAEKHSIFNTVKDVSKGLAACSDEPGS